MSIQHVVDCNPAPLAQNGGFAQGQAVDKFTPGGSRVTFRTRVAIPNATYIAGVNVTLLPAPGAGKMYLLKAASIEWGGSLAVPAFAATTAGVLGGFTPPNAAYNAALNGLAALAWSNYTQAASNTAIYIGLPAAAGVAVTATLTNAGMVAAGTVSGYLQFEPINATATAAAAAVLQNQPMVLNTPTQPTGPAIVGTNNRIIVTVDWELQDFPVTT